PSFVVDVSAAWEAKQRALDAYQSQLHQPRTAEPGAGWATAPATTQVPVAAAAPAATKVSSPEFRLAVAGRAQHFGLIIGAAYGEPFLSPLPLAVADPLALLPRGLR
ncbi:MAG TPA: hypothetical protein VN811_17125, partial [Thermoanaerobaculia bacterium]|nr:hypothetical protein [Thermoanaerobaculia bacterium]